MENLSTLTLQLLAGGSILVYLLMVATVRLNNKTQQRKEIQDMFRKTDQQTGFWVRDRLLQRYKSQNRLTLPTVTLWLTPTLLVAVDAAALILSFTGRDIGHMASVVIVIAGVYGMVLITGTIGCIMIAITGDEYDTTLYLEDILVFNELWFFQTALNQSPEQAQRHELVGYMAVGGYRHQIRNFDELTHLRKNEDRVKELGELQVELQKNKKNQNQPQFIEKRAERQRLIEELAPVWRGIHNATASK